ncbi:2-keto-4-pentenoate hydratase [Sphingomonas carotinifaciens]|uniref:2-keto-4-pentenoate hydratase n=1 Tax=Sphingomonas TaxID=13687 RepID=UPI001F0839B1|nr:2-keto-4-pentenoate hydratase [Sphingomonas carotinifaciens]
MQPDIDTSAISNRARIADSFVAARHAGHALPDYPGERPTVLGDAYAVQDAALERHGGTVAGWKVGRINPPIGTADRLAGPIFADQVIASEPPPAMPVYAGGFAAAEAEFLMRIGTAPDPAQRHFTRDDARALVDAVHVGIEIASSPYPHINADGALVTISDFGNNNGLVIGAEVPDWRDTDLLCWPVELWINDARIGAAIAADMLDGPFGAVAFLAGHLAARGKPLVVGQWVSTGAVTGVHPVAVGDRVEARFDGSYRLACTIKAQG